MLKILLYLIFMTPIYFLKNKIWVIQNFFLILSLLFILIFNWGNFNSEMSYILSIDLISYSLIVLSFWICSLMFLSSEKVYKMKNFKNKFMFALIMLMSFLFLTFSVSNLFGFYLFFESSLIPTVFLILGWGYQPERLQAGVYLLFYTLFASLPLLICIFLVLNLNFSLNFMILMSVSVLGDFVYLFMVLAFLVKMPMFFVHLWLPKAHVEAPVAGSMILAGVLLKLGGYGLLRVFPFLIESSLKFNKWWMSISLIGGILVSLMCLRQMDLKALIAYSSVAHMGIVLMGMMTLTNWGLMGSLCLMIAHGLCSSGLFCLANMSYERMKSRSLMINKGLLNFMPSFSLWWFLLCAGNMSAPPTLNLLGEISLLNSIVSWSYFSMGGLAFLSFFSAAYSLFLYSMSQHGKLYSAMFSFSTGVIREYLSLFLHWFPLNFFILKSEVSTLWI